MGGGGGDKLSFLSEHPAGSSNDSVIMMTIAKNSDRSLTWASMGILLFSSVQRNEQYSVGK